MAVVESVAMAPRQGADLVLQGIEKATRRNLGGRVEGGLTPGNVANQLRSLRQGASTLVDQFRKENLRKFPEGGRYIEGLGPPTAHPAITLPFKLAAASDIMGRPIAASRTATSMARAQAIREGTKGTARKARIEQLLKNPTTEMLDEMDRQAELSVFMSENEVVRKWRNFVADGKARHLQWVLPFVRSATNVGERTFDYSPLSWARVVKRAGDLYKVAANTPGVTEAERVLLRQARGRLTEQTGRATTGTLGSLLAGYAMASNINGWYQSGTAEQRRRRQAGEPSAAVRIGDTWVRLDRNFGPVGTVMLIGAQLRELSRQDAEEQGQSDDSDTTVRGLETGLRGAIARHGSQLMEFVGDAVQPATLLETLKAMYEITPARNIADLFNIAKGGAAGAESAERYARWTATGPIPSLLRRVTRVTDPVQRDITAETWPGRLRQQAQAAVPGLSERLPARMDPLGEPVRREGGGAYALSPIAITSDRLDDPLRAELNRVGYVVEHRRRPGEPDAEYRARMERVGPAVRVALEAEINSPEYRAETERIVEQLRMLNPELDDDALFEIAEEQTAVARKARLQNVARVARAEASETVIDENVPSGFEALFEP